MFIEYLVFSGVTWSADHSWNIFFLPWLLQIYRKAAFKMVSEGLDSLTVNKENLQDYVGRPLFSHDRMYDKTPAGVIAGLAWTSMGQL